MQVGPNCLVVAVKTGIDLDAALDRAVARLIPMAMAEEAGISVSRVARGLYEARVTRDVPCGTTEEKWGGILR